LAKAFAAKCEIREARQTEVQLESKTQSSERRELEALRLASRAAMAIATLEQHQKSLAQEVGERRKRLRNVQLAIQHRERMGTLPMEGIDTIEISPADNALIYDPLRGL
jgi:hypothetical protein